jgi:hypothetical protein
MWRIIIGLAILSALITFLFIKPLSHDGMQEEDREVCVVSCYPLFRCCYILEQFRQYLEANGYDTSQMGLLEETVSTTSAEKVPVVDEKPAV